MSVPAPPRRRRFSPPAHAGYAARPLRSAARRVRRVRLWWRRSLQVRVVVTTLVVSATVVLLLALVLLQQIGRGLLDAKTSASLVEANSGLSEVKAAVAALETSDAARVDETLATSLEVLAKRGQPGRYDVVIAPGRASLSGLQAGSARVTQVPEALRDRVASAEESAQVYTYAPVPGGAGSGSGPGLVVGMAFIAPTDRYQLYYLFRLDAEAETLSLVRRTLALAGFALVALLALIAALVTRQVVLPVRLAARTAERLTAGRLEERMSIRGEDDLARLATAFNRMAAGLQRQIRELEELSRVQQRFVADVSHELRTPLTTVRMAADLLHSGRGDFAPEVARSTELLQAELDRFEALLADLLEISRFDAGFAVLDVEPVDLGALVRRVVDATRPLAAQRGATVDASAVPAGHVVAEVDPRRVERILRNLLVNAVEHAEGLPVRLELAGDDDAVAVLVEDSGIGLRPGEETRVFDRFWRADPSRARRIGGTGLGLAISLEDALLHRGRLEAWGSPGKGARFVLTLPRQAGGTASGSPIPLAREGAESAPAGDASGSTPSPGEPPVPVGQGRPSRAC